MYGGYCDVSIIGKVIAQGGSLAFCEHMMSAGKFGEGVERHTWSQPVALQVEKVYDGRKENK